MSEDFALQGIGVALLAPAPHINFEFQGGEPLPNFGMVRKIVARATIGIVFQSFNLFPGLVRVTGGPGREVGVG